MMENLKMHTPNLADENYKKLASLFPNAVTETVDENGEVVRAIDADVLRQEISATVVEGQQERYQFTWPDKKKSVVLANQPIAKTLRLDREKSVGRDGTPGSIDTENIYIEGDNLDALKLLQETYLGKVKMIYIDPPYNTGSDAFLYDDDFDVNLSEEEGRTDYKDENGNIIWNEKRFKDNPASNGRFHTDWLNMLYPRSRIAKDLLSDDGVIFISIDENEQENLKKICDEIFGEQNFYTCFAWVNSVADVINDESKFAGANLGKIKKSFESILMYTRTSKYDLPLDGASTDFIIKLVTNGGNNISRLNVPAGLSCTSNADKVIRGHVGGNNDYFDIISEKGMIIKNGMLTNDVIIEGPLRNPNMLKRFFDGEKVIDAKGQQLVDVFIADNGMLHTKKIRKGDTPSNVLVGKSTTKNGTLMLKNMFGNKIFDFAKPVELLTYLISKSMADDSIILDFFSGSATTAHAVMQLNAEEAVGGSQEIHHGAAA